MTRTACPAPDVVNKLADNSVLGAVLAAGLRAVIAEPRITEDGAARRRSRAPAAPRCTASSAT